MFVVGAIVVVVVVVAMVDIVVVVSFAVVAAAVFVLSRKLFFSQETGTAKSCYVTERCKEFEFLLLDSLFMEKK